VARVSVQLNRRDRRLLARRGYRPEDLGKVYNRMAPPTRPGPPAPVKDPTPTEPTAALPKTAGEWEHYLQGIDTPEKFTEVFADGSFKAALSSYATAQNSEREDMLAQLREQTEAQLTDWLKENQDQMVKSANRLNLDVARSAGARPSPASNNPRAKGAPLDGIWPDFYCFLQDIWHGNKQQGPEAQARLAQLYNYSERVPSEGGLLVPEEFRTQIMQLAMENSVVRPRATVIPMGSPRVHIPSVDETSRVSSIFGGVIVYRTEEGAEFTESGAAFSSIKLDVTKQTALSHVPNELIRDWGAFGSFMDATLPAAMGFYEDLDFLSAATGPARRSVRCTPPTRR
jgi:HK97 family phage major capsid protein